MLLNKASTLQMVKSMLLADSLIVLGLATVSLGTIQEADGPKEHTFWLCNAGQETVTLAQGYTSCGCTTIHFDKARLLAPGDSSKVTLRFNPRGKGGEFHEMGTIEYSSEKTKVKGERSKRINLTLTGNCITSEETLMRQFPIRINDHLRISANRFDLGIMHKGETRERHVTLLHQDEQNRKETITIHFTPDTKLTKGLHHIAYPVSTTIKGCRVETTITLDVLIK